MFHSESDYGEKAVADKVRIEIRASLRLQVLCDHRTLVEELHRVFFPFHVWVPGIKDREKLLQERRIRLDVVHNLDLVEEY